MTLRAGTVAVALLGAACGAGLDRSELEGNPLPAHSVDDVPAHGHQVEVRVARGGTVKGELLAVEAHALSILTPAGDLALVMPWTVDEVELEHATATRDDLELLYQYARFPQGLPTTFRRNR